MVILFIYYKKWFKFGYADELATSSKNAPTTLPSTSLSTETIKIIIYIIFLYIIYMSICKYIKIAPQTSETSDILDVNNHQLCYHYDKNTNIFKIDNISTVIKYNNKVNSLQLSADSNKSMNNLSATITYTIQDNQRKNLGQNSCVFTSNQCNIDNFMKLPENTCTMMCINPVEKYDTLNIASYIYDGNKNWNICSNSTCTKETNNNIISTLIPIQLAIPAIQSIPAIPSSIPVIPSSNSSPSNSSPSNSSPSNSSPSDLSSSNLPATSETSS